MKRIIALVLLLFTVVLPIYAQDSYCLTSTSIGTIQTVDTNIQPIYFAMGDKLKFIYLWGSTPAPFVTISIDGSPVFDLQLGQNNIYTVPSDGWYSIAFKSSDLSVVKVSISCVVNTATNTPDNPDPEFDGSNWQYGASSVAVIFVNWDNPDNPSLDLYDFATETYYKNFVTSDMVGDLMVNPPLTNTLVFSFGSIDVYILDTGELQFNMTDSEGKTFVFILPDLTGDGAYGYIIDPPA